MLCYAYAYAMLMLCYACDAVLYYSFACVHVPPNANYLNIIDLSMSEYLSALNILQYWSMAKSLNRSERN